MPARGRPIFLFTLIISDFYDIIIIDNEIPMLYKIGKLKKHHQLFFSLVVMSGMIALWRGIWGLLDIYLLPDNLSLSYVLSFVIGIVVIGVTHYTVDKLI